MFLFPVVTQAQAVYQLGNIFALFAGVLLAFSMVFFGGGFVIYLARLGRPYRDEGLNLMQWGVTMLFLFVVCAIISRWWLLYPFALPWILAFGIIGLGIWAAFELKSAPAEEEHTHR